ncbi:F-actin-capping protein subunit alpha [Nakaseomyces bracarensis]|uniref:F-actin-capping protein subunit alpha n=1 Tax=Nakaseomyces bracarensis TaxID=273131 RepID=A0ABR4NN26_9SACH
MSDFGTIINQIIKDSPAGEIEEVYKDLVTIAGEASKDTIIDAISEYNVVNTVPVDVDGKDVIVSKFNKEGTKFVDPLNKVQFSVDHLHRKGIDVASYEKGLDADQEQYAKELRLYLGDNFPGKATCAVYPVPNEDSKTAIIIVSTKYNPANFWNGLWKSEYIYDSSDKSLSGTIDVNVHYYEDGNVSFKSSKEINETDVSNPINTITKVENTFEEELQVTFSDLNEKQFKSLRRRLPITRSKVNWGKAIGNYRLGRDAAQGM